MPAQPPPLSSPKHSMIDKRLDFAKEVYVAAIRNGKQNDTALAMAKNSIIDYQELFAFAYETVERSL